MEYGKFLLMESGIPGFGIRKTAQGIRKPINDWNPESSSTDKEWNPVPRTRIKDCPGFPYFGRHASFTNHLFFFSLAPTVAPKTTRVPEETPSRKVTPKPSGTTTVIVESSSKSGGKTDYTKKSKEEGIEHQSFFISFPYYL